jgi:hypothetical protein
VYSILHVVYSIALNHMYCGCDTGPNLPVLLKSWKTVQFIKPNDPDGKGQGPLHENPTNMPCGQ